MRNEILEYFRKANGNYVSGEQISRDLNVSRTAIWKHINILKSRGYIFESSTRKGYRLIYAPNLLTPLEIASVLHTETLGKKVVYFESTPPTNEEAKKIAREGAEEGTIVVAEEQTTGRGRLTRHIYSPFAKGIWFSVIFRPTFFPMEETWPLRDSALSFTLPRCPAKLSRILWKAAARFPMLSFLSKYFCSTSCVKSPCARVSE